MKTRWKEGTKQLAIRLPIETLDRIDHRVAELTASFHGIVTVTRSDVIREALGRAFPSPEPIVVKHTKQETIEMLQSALALGVDIKVHQARMAIHEALLQLQADDAPMLPFRVGQLVAIVNPEREMCGRYGRIRLLPNPKHRLRDPESRDSPEEVARIKAIEHDMQTCYTVDIPGRGPQQYAADELADGEPF